VVLRYQEIEEWSSVDPMEAQMNTVDDNDYDLIWIPMKVEQRCYMAQKSKLGSDESSLVRINYEFPDLRELLNAPTVKDGKRVGVREFVMVDGELAEVLAWNDVPTFFVKILKTKQLKEVEPWRIEKIERSEISSL
jgi:hypothetical protein